MNEILLKTVDENQVVAYEYDDYDDKKSEAYDDKALIDKTYKLEDVLEELAAKRKELEVKDKQICELTIEKEHAISTEQKQTRLFENYKKTHRNEVRKSKQALEQKLTIEHENQYNDLKEKYDKLSAMSAWNSSSSATDYFDCEEIYNELISLAHETYQKLSVTTTTSTKIARYQFADENSQWRDFDKAICCELDKLKTTADRVEYRANGFKYEARLIDSKTQKKQGLGDVFAIQKNITHSTERWIRKDFVLSADTSQDHKYNVLFGDSPIKLPKACVQNLISRFSFGNHYKTSCKKLAELAQVFSSFSHGYKYTNVDLFVKPALLYSWLVMALERDYTAMRIVLHGATTEAYKGIQNDAIGFNLKTAGFRPGGGQAHGHGTYFGFSSHVTDHYNQEKVGGSCKGTALICLLLTHDQMSLKNGSYNTFKLHQPADCNFDNCIAVFENALVLILGKIVPVCVTGGGRTGVLSYSQP